MQKIYVFKIILCLNAILSLLNSHILQKIKLKMIFINDIIYLPETYILAYDF